MKKVIIITFIIFILIQIIRIDKSVPKINKDKDFLVVNNVGSDIQKIVKNSCYDCHSLESKYPWYSNIAPVSWIIKDHINEGRKDLNFSTFSDYNEYQKKYIISKCIETLQKNEMPLKGYSSFHKEAILSKKEINKLVNFFEQLKSTL